MNKLTKIILVMFLLLTIGYGLSTANAAVPHLLNYQGRLTDRDNRPLEGSYAITFRIYDAETSGNLLWEETHSGVIIQKGIFSVLLGSVTNLNLRFDKPYFLEIKVGSEVMSPRQRLTSAGYAINAENGVPKGAIIMWSGLISDIPLGWALCDGANGTPDLRDKFIVGARQDNGGVVKTNVRGSLEQSGGEAKHTLTVAEMPAHTHSESGHAGWGGRGGDDQAGCNIAAETGSMGGGQAHENCPPFYALAFIMKL